jgi:hypothetical protein
LQKIKINLMRFIIFTFVLLFSIQISAQKNCEYTVEVTDSLGTLKTTKEFLMFEKRFGNNENYIFFSLSVDNGTPILNYQLLQKNTDFSKAFCVDASSKIYFQLANGKIITLIHNKVENCGTFFRNDDKNVRVLSANFLFLINSIEELKASPISLMRVKYSTETVDYIIREDLNSELLNETVKSANYFVDYLHCVK